MNCFTKQQKYRRLVLVEYYMSFTLRMSFHLEDCRLLIWKFFTADCIIIRFASMLTILLLNYCRTSTCGNLFFWMLRLKTVCHTWTWTCTQTSLRCLVLSSFVSKSSIFSILWSCNFEQYFKFWFIVKLKRNFRIPFGI